MSQQINLMIARPPGPRFSAAMAVLAVVLVMFAMLGYWQFQRHNTGMRQQRLAQDEREHQTLRLNRDGLQAELAARTARRQARLAATDSGRRILSPALQTRLGSGEFGSASGYARHLEILAQIPGTGVWLTSIAITRAGKGMSLEGRALDRKAVLAYAEVLNSRFAALDLAFSALELNAVADESASGSAVPVTFRLY